jgi:Putative phage tail protein
MPFISRGEPYMPVPAPAPAPPPVQTPPTPAVDPVTTGVSIKELTDQLYGKPIPVSLGGRRRMGGYVCWGPRLRYASNGQRLWSFGVSFGFSADPDGRRDVLEIRFDSTIVYSALTGVVVPWLKWRFHPGTETQEPDPLAVLMQGTAATAFRGQMVMFFEDVPSNTIPFVGALICDRVSGGGLTAMPFDTPTTSAIRSIGAIDWAAGIMYTNGRDTSYRLIAHRINDRTQLSDVPIINLHTAFIEFDEIAFLWCPEGQVIFGVADDGGGLYAYLVALDPDAAAIVAEAPAPGGWNVFGGLTYYADMTTGASVVVVASIDILIANSLHIDFYTQSGGFGFNWVSPSNLGGLGSGAVTAVIRAPDHGLQARFLVSQGTKLVLATVDVTNQTVGLALVYTASAVINNLHGDPLDSGVVLFLADGTALKLDTTASYAVLWSTSPGFTVPTPGGVGNTIPSTEGWRKTLPTFAIYDGGIWFLDLTTGVSTFEATTGSEAGGHIMFDAAINLMIITDNGDPRAYIVSGTSDDTIPIATALTKLAQFWGYSADEFEVLNVPGDWIAVIIAYDTTFQDLLQLLKSVYPWDVIQTDKLRVVQRDLGTVLTVDGTIIAKDIKGTDGDQPAVLTTIAEDVEQPAINELQFIDPARDYNWNLARYKQPREPVAVSSSVSTHQIKIPIVMAMDDAKMLIAAKSYRDRVARATHAFTGMPSTFKYEPGDILRIDTGLRTIDATKVTSTDAGSDWSMQFQLESLLATGPLFDPTFWQSGVLPTDSGTPPPATVVATDGSEIAIFLDTPILTSADAIGDGTGLRHHYAIATRSPDGFSLRYEVSIFGGQNYYLPIIAVPLYGELVANLGTTSTPFMTDFSNALTFKRVCGDPALLQTLTYDQLMNSEQVFAVGRAGRWEILGAGLTVTTNADGTITLTGLMRGRRGSEVFCGTHAVGDQVVYVGTGNALAPAIASARSIFWLAQFIGTPFGYTSAIQNGFGSTGLAETGYTFGVVLSSPITGIAEQPYAPVHLDAVISGSNIVLDWDRRDRLDFSHGGGADPPMSETAELYDVVILDGAGAVKRTYADQAPPPFTYPAADITADWGSMPAALQFDVYQNSALVGRGFNGRATVTL